jgi:hypothetical protein
MTGPEGAPPGGDPWRDETADHIDHLSRLLRGAGEPDDGVPSYVPADWNTAAPNELGRLEAGKAVPELEKYLGDFSTPPHRVLLLSDIPRLIGGHKSNDFMRRAEATPADAPPADEDAFDMTDMALGAQSWGDFLAYGNDMERLADQQYSDALFAAQQTVTDARERGMNIDVLLVPGTVNMSASDYFTRLQRLAQDLGVPVVINTEDHSDEFPYEEFRRFDPPAAATVEQYWEQRAQEMRPRKPVRIVEAPTEDELAAALDKFWDLRGEDESAFNDNVLSVLARATPESLNAIVSGNHRHVLRMITQTPREIYNRVANAQCTNARVIMAKLGDEPTFELLMQETNQDLWGADPGRLAIPLGLYARRDNNVRDLLKLAVGIAAHHRADTQEGVPLQTLLSSLYYSYSPAVAPLIADHLSGYLEDVHPQQTKVVRDIVKEKLPDYIDVMQSLPDSPERTFALDVIKQGAVEMLRQDVDPHAEFDQFTGLRRTAGDALLKMGVTDQGELLRNHMLWLYEHCDSILKNAYFTEQYVQYRSLYGDIPEISQHITLYP